MELRVLRYFLAVAKEENMTEAANVLHVSQPTLSRQIADLEDELGKKLFIRTNRSTVLTEEGMHLRQRAEEILSLVDQTEAEIASEDADNITGCIRIGAAETFAAHHLTDIFAQIHKAHPGVTCELFSGNADLVEEKIERGLLDFGLLLEPGASTLSKFESICLPEKHSVGILTTKDSEWAQHAVIHPKDLIGMPLLRSSRNTTQIYDLTEWSRGKLQESDLNIVGSFDLIRNASLLIKTGITNAVSIDHLIQKEDKDLLFIPFEPTLTMSSYVVWKKYRFFSKAAERFLNDLQQSLL